MRIALVQQPVGSHFPENLERGLAAAGKAVDEGARLVVFPELSFQPFFPQRRKADSPTPHSEPVPGPTTERISRFARERQVVVVFNLWEEDGDRRFDSSPVIDADGHLLGVTRMVHIYEGPGFFEKDYYHPGDRGAPVYQTAVGPLGVAICYDRHFPEYMRALGVGGAELVVIPQAGSVGEWPEGLFEAELQVASLQNGYFCALANRVGREERLEFAGESFVTDPRGQVIGRAAAGEAALLLVDLDRDLIAGSPAKRHFLPDRRPGIYPLSGED